MATAHTSHFNTDHHLSRSSCDLSFSGEIGAHRDSSASDFLSGVDLESGVLEGKPHLDGKTERDCRICHLGLEGNERENGAAIDLGCSCKGDLGAAHKKCAETWFKIKGNMFKLHLLPHSGFSLHASCLSFTDMRDMWCPCSQCRW
ncbi:hypothetical protein P3X46_015676 [Hevea brasiliensis]|uniref:RING-CH-type domain-containing protein n=1 Tax=Hevea brasiliensis TaxID=3981 RepID=A0ABQ9LZZ6_HEVBR|nr:hypothetical protein P3X46_015676 [Hevea brasiliensis]